MKLYQNKKEKGTHMITHEKRRKPRTKTPLCLAALSLLVAVLTACQGGGQEAALQQQVNELTSQLEQTQQELSEANAQLAMLLSGGETQPIEEPVDDAPLDEPLEDPAMQEPLDETPSFAPVEVVLDLSSGGELRIARSDSFSALEGDTLRLAITSDIAGGTVDFVLISPAGEEQTVTISGGDEEQSIPLTEGTWIYNCIGVFESGQVQIVGTIA
jgi:cell division protein FtsB